MRVLVSAGEPSGFLFAALLRQALARAAPGPGVDCVRPGPGVEPAVGFIEGLRAAPKERRRLQLVSARVARDRPDRVVLIGYPGFNLPLGTRCRELGVPVLFLAPPQVWAWGRWRVRSLSRAADRVVCLFPFEEAGLRRAGVDAVFSGYPLLDVLDRARERRDTLTRLGLEEHERYVAFLPGSRPQEIRFHRPLFARVFGRLRASEPGLHGVVVPAPGPDPLAGLARRYGIIRHADCAVVVSGTATLETALLGTPQVVTYHLSFVSRLLARALVRGRPFGLPNILLGAGTVPELLEPSAARLSAMVQGFLHDPGRKDRARQDADRLRQMLGPGGAIGRIASLVLGDFRRQGSQPGGAAV